MGLYSDIWLVDGVYCITNYNIYIYIYMSPLHLYHIPVKLLFFSMFCYKRCYQEESANKYIWT